METNVANFVARGTNLEKFWVCYCFINVSSRYPANNATMCRHNASTAGINARHRPSVAEWLTSISQHRIRCKNVTNAQRIGGGQHRSHHGNDISACLLPPQCQQKRSQRRTDVDLLLVCRGYNFAIILPPCNHCRYIIIVSIPYDLR